MVNIEEYVQEVIDNPRLLFQEYLEDPPETEEELLDFIKVFFRFKGRSVTPPVLAVCPNHVAPVRFIYDRYFERCQKFFIFANRTGSKTTGLAISHILDFLFKGNVDINSAGAIYRQAQQCRDYFEKIVQGFPVKTYEEEIHKNVPTVSVTGSRVEIMTGTMESMNAPHPQILAIDEVELMSSDVLEQAFSMSMSEGEVKAKDILLSTRKSTSGNVQRLLDDIEKGERDFTVYSWCIWETIERCDCETCPPRPYQECLDAKKRDDNLNVVTFYDRCSGKARKSDGYLKLSDVLDKFKNMNLKTWLGEWECLKTTSLNLLVFPWFDPSAGGGNVISREAMKEILNLRN